MNKAITVLVALLLVGPTLPLLAVGLLANPAANPACVTGAGLTVGQIPGSLAVTSGDGHTVTLDGAQLTNAATIITTGGRVPGVNRDAITVALMAGLTESGLRNLSNATAYPQTAGMPNDGDGADHDSLGLFQMRHASGWGTVENLMDPQFQVRAFLGGPTGPNYPSPRGLLDIPAWEDMGQGQAAQAVENSAYPNRYANWQQAAETILMALTQPGGTSNTTSTISDGSAVPESSGVVFPLPASTWTETSRFGWRIHPITHVTTFHAGTDYAAPDGTPILAAADGVVTYAGPKGGYGNAITIQHTIGGQTFTSLYGHMWDGHLYVTAGQRVVIGQHIGDVGSNGNSTGPHLHFEIHDSSGQAIDSNQWLAGHDAASVDTPAVSAAGCYLPGGQA